MKLVFFHLLLITLATSFSLLIDPSITIPLNQRNVYIPINFQGNTGEVSFDVKGLPSGLSLRNGIITGQTDNTNGYFPILIDAYDEQGNSASKICVLKVGSSTSSGNPPSNQRVTTNTFSSSSTTSFLGNNNQNFQSSNMRSTRNTIGINTQQRSQQTNGLDINTQRTSLNTNNDRTRSLDDFLETLNLSTENSNRPQSPVSNRNINTNINSQIITTTTTSNTRRNRNTQRNTLPSNPQLVNLDNLLDELAPRPQLPVNNQNIQTTTTFQSFSPVNRVPNTIPDRIRNTQAPKSQANRNVVTQDDIRTSAVFQRQINANKAIANLLDIVDQLRANVNAAQGDIQALSTQLQNAINFQRNTEAKITAAQNRVSRLKEAIGNMQSKINLLNQQLAQLENDFKDTSKTISSQQSTIQNLNNQINKYQKVIEELNEQIEDTNQQLEQKQEQIQQTIREIQDIKIKLEKKKRQVQDIDNLIDDSVRDIVNIQQQIDNLKKKLNDAIQRKVQAERQQIKLRNLKANAPTQIVKMEDQIRIKNRLVEDLQDDKGDILDHLKDLNDKVDFNTNQLDTFMMKLKQIQTQIKVIHGNKADFDEAIAQKNQEIQQAQKTLNYLQSQLQPYQQALSVAYNQGNQASQSVNIAQQNLVAITTRYQQDNSKLQNALINLEKARSQKELADLAMQQLLQERSSVLPFSIVPNGNGLTNPGNPSGNNPSGSALGPLPSGSAQALNSLIRSSTTTVSSSQSSTQYPFSLYRKIETISGLAPYLGSNGNIIPQFYQDNQGITFNGNFRCANNFSERFQGTVRSLGRNAITIMTQQGATIVGAISTCTSGFASKPNYHIKTGDKISFYGESIGNGIYNIYSLNCK